MQSLLVARLLHSRADTTRDGTYPSSAVYLSKDSILKSEVMNSYQQAVCKSVKIPKVQTHSRHWYLLHHHKRLASVINFFLV